ncbi:MAG TPA: hypothetical protein DIT07_09750 [Sphingobacteriaceae bacterium]|nr:hypothetical protein [Sphingobacteriaceae bacterium]
MVNLFIFLAFFFSSASGSVFEKSDKPDIDIKWYIQKEKINPDTYKVTIDTRKVNRYIQLSDIRFVAEFRNIKGDLLSRDTINFFTKAPGNVVPLAGNHVSSMTYKQQYGATAKITGIRLLYKWDDSSISLEPDPIEEKAIIKDLVYGEGSAAVSDSP